MNPAMSHDPLLHRLAQLNWPTPPADHPDPAPGQLWRSTWNGVASIVVTLAPPTGRNVAVAVASADQTGDEGTVVADTLLGMTVAVWTTITADIKFFTLEHRITDLTAASLDTVPDVRLNGTPGAWVPIVDELDDRALIRADLVDQIEALANADWLPETPTAVATVGDLAAQASITPSILARELGITPGDARRLTQGHRAPSPTEISALTELLGAVPASTATFDEALVASMDAPEFRPALQLVADRHHAGDDVAARRSFAGTMMAMAARPREQGPRNWRAMIRDALLHED